MTNKEAIEDLEFMVEYDDFASLHTETIEIAIKALQTESCEDAISRQAAIKAIWDGTNMDIYTREVKETLEGLPSVQPEGKTGRWIKNKEQGVQAVGYLIYHCSECGREISSKYHGKTSLLKEYPYCHCGARMGAKE